MLFIIYWHVWFPVLSWHERNFELSQSNLLLQLSVYEYNLVVLEVIVDVLVLVLVIKDVVDVSVDVRVKVVVLLDIKVEVAVVFADLFMVNDLWIESFENSFLSFVWMTDKHFGNGDSIFLIPQ